MKPCHKCGESMPNYLAERSRCANENCELFYDPTQPPTIDESNALRAQGFMEGVQWEREGKRETFAEQLAHVGNGCINYPNVQKLIAQTVELFEGGSQKKAAQRLGISPQYLNDILRGRREISEAVAAKYGLRRVVIFEKMEDPK